MLTDTTPAGKTLCRSGLITRGEVRPNHHRRCLNAARRGFYGWETDLSGFVLKALSWTGLIWKLKPVPLSAYENYHPIPDGRKLSVPRSHPAWHNGSDCA